jgi:hypothetical protein
MRRTRLCLGDWDLESDRVAIVEPNLVVEAYGGSALPKLLRNAEAIFTPAATHGKIVGDRIAIVGRIVGANYLLCLCARLWLRRRMVILRRVRRVVARDGSKGRGCGLGAGRCDEFELLETV